VRSAFSSANPSAELFSLSFRNNPGGIRYLHCVDGTLIDMKYFLTAAATASLFVEIAYFGMGGELYANIFGWGVECVQVLKGDDSGAPFGGNEDLGSNANGADFGDEVFDPDGPSLGEQIVEYMEEHHGGVESVVRPTGGTGGG
jgi:hypothetical protein